VSKHTRNLTGPLVEKDYLHGVEISILVVVGVTAGVGPTFVYSQVHVWWPVRIALSEEGD